MTIDGKATDNLTQEKLCRVGDSVKIGLTSTSSSISVRGEEYRQREITVLSV